MKQVFIRFLIGAVLACVGYFIGETGQGYVTAESVQEYEKLCASAVPTDALLDSTYTVSTVKVMKVPVKTYSYDYTYYVNGVAYRGKYSSNLEATSLDRKVWYDKNNPAKSESTDPCAAYEQMKTKTVSSYQKWFGYLALPLVIIGVVLVYGSIKRFFRVLFSGNQPQQ